MRHNTPPLSVLLASYNGERYIEEQLKSIAAQTYTDFQLIICDDNSQDETVRIIEKFRAKHPRIVLHQNTTTLGYVKNFEKLIGLCHTPYMALCDQDDIWKPDKLEKQMRYMHMTEAENKTIPVLIHSDLSVHNANGTQLHPSYFAYRGYALGSKKDLGHILGPCGVMGNTILFNQALKKLILPFPPMLTNHDYWIALISELFGTRVTLDTPLVRYRLHTHNASNTQASLSSRKHYLQFYLQCMRGDCRLPYTDSGREAVLQYLLDNYVVKKEAEDTIAAFLHYLRQQGSRSTRIYAMIRYAYVKKSIPFQIKTALKILFKSRQ